MTDEELQASAEPTIEPTIQADDAPVIPENGADSVPAEETKVTFSPEQQEIFNAAKAKDTKKFHDKRREAEGYQAELEALKASIPQPTEPQIPSPPDALMLDDDEFKRQSAEYVEAIERRAEFRANVKVQTEQTAAQQQTKLFEQQQRRVAEGNTFAERSRKLGFDDTEMGQSLVTLQQMGLGTDFQQDLVAHENGPEVIDYLAKNPDALDQMRSMSSMQAGSYIATNIVPKALNAKKTTSAPIPVDFVNGGGSPEKPLGPPGAVFK